MIDLEGFQKLLEELISQNPGVSEGLIEELLSQYADLTETAVNDRGENILRFPNGTELLYEAEA